MDEEPANSDGSNGSEDRSDPGSGSDVLGEERGSMGSSSVGTSSVGGSLSTLNRKVRALFTAPRTLTAEPVLFLFNIASYVVWITSQDVIVKKTCLVSLNYPEWICNDLSNYELEEIAVQSRVSNFLMWRSILEAGLKVVAVPVLGWWGDKWGWRNPLMFALFGLGLESTVLLLNSRMASWPMEVILSSSFFYGLSGGTHGLLMAAFSFMARITTDESRTMRMGILDGFYYLGSPVGLALGPPLFRLGGYTGVFGTAVIIYAVAILYVFLRIPGGRLHQVEGSELNERDAEVDCCGVGRFVDAFKTTVKRRPEKVRRYILISIIAMLFDSFVIWGEGNVKYLFAQKTLKWSYSKYSYFSSISSFLTVIGALVIVPIITLWTSWSDCVIGILGASSRAITRIFFASATSPQLDWLMYVGCVFGVASPLAPIAVRSIISKLALEDVGQVFSVMAVGETILPFAASPAYTHLYTSAIGSYPGGFYILSFALNVCMGLCFVYILTSMRRRARLREE